MISNDEEVVFAQKQVSLKHLLGWVSCATNDTSKSKKSTTYVYLSKKNIFSDKIINSRTSILPSQSAQNLHL